MIRTFLAVLLLLGIGVFGMCFNIIFRGKEFPNSDVGTNEEMKKIGIKCFRIEDEEMHQAMRKEKCNGNRTAACDNCAYFKLEQ